MQSPIISQKSIMTRFDSELGTLTVARSESTINGRPSVACLFIFAQGSTPRLFKHGRSISDVQPVAEVIYIWPIEGGELKQNSTIFNS